MTSFKNVTLLGRGLLGSFVLTALIDAGFTVTLLGRSHKNAEGLPAGVKFVAVDYSSIDSLEAAFRGQDAIVSTVGMEGIPGQKLIIDAAIKVGVKRFIPSDFGSLSTDPAAADLPHHLAMVEIQKYIKAKADAGLIDYTIFSIGPFTDLLIKFGLAFDWENKSAEVWEGGHSRISTTSLAGTASAIAGALKNPEATKNRNLFVHEHVVTQSQLLDLAKKYSPPGTKWEVTNVGDSEAELNRLERLVREKPELPNIIALLKATLMSGKFKAYYEHVDNELVGLEILSDADLDAKVAAAYS